MNAIVQVNTIKLSFRNALMTLDFIIPSKKTLLDERGKTCGILTLPITFLFYYNSKSP